MEEKVFTIITDINKLCLRKILSEKTIRKIAANYCTRFKSEENLIQNVKEYVKSILYASLKKNSDLQLKFISLYLKIYKEVNDLYNVEETEETFSLYLRLALELSFKKNPEVEIDSALKSLYRISIKEKRMIQKENINFKGNTNIENQT